MTGTEGAHLEHAGNYPLPFEFFAYPGLRIGEALTLVTVHPEGYEGHVRPHRPLDRPEPETTR